MKELINSGKEAHASIMVATEASSEIKKNQDPGSNYCWEKYLNSIWPWWNTNVKVEKVESSLALSISLPEVLIKFDNIFKAGIKRYKKCDMVVRILKKSLIYFVYAIFSYLLCDNCLWPKTNWGNINKAKPS